MFGLTRDALIIRINRFSPYRFFQERKKPTLVFLAAFHIQWMIAKRLPTLRWCVCFFKET